MEELIFDVKSLLGKGEGATDEYSLDMISDFEDKDIIPKGRLKGKVFIMKLEQGFNVEIKNIEISLEMTCNKCLKKYKQKVEIPSENWMFLLKKSKEDEKEGDFFYVDTKTWTVDITEFLRQEIILHFPLIPVCSTHCKGITIEKNV